MARDDVEISTRTSGTGTLIERPTSQDRSKQEQPNSQLFLGLDRLCTLYMSGADGRALAAASVGSLAGRMTEGTRGRAGHGITQQREAVAAVA
jgi:hypothetical protein